MGSSLTAGMARVMAELWGSGRCVACRQPKERPQSGVLASSFVCTACLDKLPRVRTGYCPHCGEFAVWPLLPVAPCQACLRSLPPWKKLYFYGAYEGLLRELILRYKGYGDIVLSRMLASMLADGQELFSAQIDMIVPVPLHVQRLRQRGFNQSHELAKALQYMYRSTQHRVPPLVAALRKSVHTAPQRSRTRGERMTAMKGTFALAHTVKGQHVLLVDDVITTGGTIRAAADVLVQAGAASVELAVLARTPRYGS